MEKSITFNPVPGKMAKSAFIIEKFHRCADCPVRKLAIKRPHSIYAWLHNWHKTWWPAWKTHQLRTCAFAANANVNAFSQVYINLESQIKR
jgi:hypothetical protein